MWVTASGILLSVAVVAGMILAGWHLAITTEGKRPPLAFGIAHGVVGAAGLAALLVALRGPARGVAMGAAAFGLWGAVLLGLALLAGIALFLLRPKALVIIAHAGLAIAGYVLAVAWASLG